MPLDPIKLPQQYENTPVECDMALGRYMRAWSQLEITTSILFHKLVDTNIVTAKIIFDAGIDQRTMRSIIDALGKYRFNPPDYRKLSSLLRRMKDAAANRNRIVHGRWQLFLTMGDKPLQAEKAEWIRFYSPSDPETLHKMFGKKPDQKLLAAHKFTLARIEQAANAVETLAKDVGDFSQGVPLLPARIPQPVF